MEHQEQQKNEQIKDQLTEMEKMMKEDPRPQAGGVLSFIGELVKITLIALAIILPVRYFLIKPFYVKGASMEPTYYNHEYLIIDEISYRFNLAKRGDVIVFKYPQDESQFFIKRVIGLPGERVVVSSGEVIIYNAENSGGIVLNESFLSESEKTTGSSDVTLKQDEYFVMGDNRNASLDSRRFGPLPKKDIIGKAWIRGWPFSRAGILEHYSFEF